MNHIPVPTHKCKTCGAYWRFIPEAMGLKSVKEITQLICWDFIDPVANKPYTF